GARPVAVEDGLSATRDVLPERLPLLVLFPRVRALEQRDDVPPLLLEHLDERACARAHRLLVPLGRRSAQRPLGGVESTRTLPIERETAPTPPWRGEPEAVRPEPCMN